MSVDSARYRVMLPWTVVYTTRLVLAALQTNHRRRRDFTRATIARSASVACTLSLLSTTPSDIKHFWLAAKENIWVQLPRPSPSVQILARSGGHSARRNK